MAKMTRELIQTLYDHGKAVFEGKESLATATNSVLETYPGQIAPSSARFYISLYEDLVTGKGSTWNQNSDLLVYYVEHIFKDQGKQAAEDALKGAMRFAKRKSRQPLIEALVSTSKTYGLALVETEIEENHTNPESEQGSEWEPSSEEYSPGFTKEEWIGLLNNPNIIGPVWGGALAMFFTEKEGATCSELGKKFGRSPTSISGNCTQLAKRIQKETNCPVLEKNGKKSYWPILFLGKGAEKEVQGSFIWKLRPELYDALSEFGIEKYLPEVIKTGIFDSWEIVDGRIKPENEQVYMIVDAINEAINARKKIRFQKVEYNVKKERVLHHGGEEYVFSPYSLVWDGDFYYVVGYSDKYKSIGSHRVDRIF